MQLLAVASLSFTVVPTFAVAALGAATSSPSNEAVKVVFRFSG